MAYKHTRVSNHGFSNYNPVSDTQFPGIAIQLVISGISRQLCVPWHEIHTCQICFTFPPREKQSSEAVDVQKDPRNVHHGGPAQNYAACYPQLYLPTNFPRALFEISCYLFFLFSVKIKKTQKVKAT